MDVHVDGGAHVDGGTRRSSCAPRSWPMPGAAMHAHACVLLFESWPARAVAYCNLSRAGRAAGRWFARRARGAVRTVGAGTRTFYCTRVASRGGSFIYKMIKLVSPHYRAVSLVCMGNGVRVDRPTRGREWAPAPCCVQTWPDLGMLVWQKGAKTVGFLFRPRRIQRVRAF